MGFEPFAFAHWTALLVLAAVVLILSWSRDSLRQERMGRLVRRILIVVLAGCELGLHLWYQVTDNWGLHALPFQLCSIMMWLSILLLLTRSRRLFEVVFFLGILGAMQAMLTPNLDEGFPSFRFFHFFIAHIAIIATCVYMCVVERFRPGLGSALRALLWLHVLALPAALTNWLTGSNFMFLARKPSTPSLLDLLAPWPWYLLQLEVVAVALCLLLLGIVRGAEWIHRLRKRR